MQGIVEYGPPDILAVLAPEEAGAPAAHGKRKPPTDVRSFAQQKFKQGKLTAGESLDLVSGERPASRSSNKHSHRDFMRRLEKMLTRLIYMRATLCIGIMSDSVHTVTQRTSCFPMR